MSDPHNRTARNIVGSNPNIDPINPYETGLKVIYGRDGKARVVSSVPHDRYRAEWEQQFDENVLNPPCFQIPPANVWGFTTIKNFLLMLRTFTRPSHQKKFYQEKKILHVMHWGTCCDLYHYTERKFYTFSDLKHQPYYDGMYFCVVSTCLTYGVNMILKNVFELKDGK